MERNQCDHYEQPRLWPSGKNPSKICMLFEFIDNVFHLFRFHVRSILQMVLGGPSAFLRNLFPPEEPCECNTLTVILPDFTANTIKNLLGLLYTGK